MRKIKKGFTIVELVIVIAVIGILSAVLIPTFSSLVSKANETALQEGLRNAYTEYASQYEYSAGTPTLYSKDKIIFTTSEFVDTNGEYIISESTNDSRVYIYSSDSKFVESTEELVSDTFLGKYDRYYAYVLNY